MNEKEAKARIKINKLLEEAGWRFFDGPQGKANILLENNIKITEHQYDDFGEDFEKSRKGFIDFLLLDENGKPFVVLEAKSGKKNPLDGKEQARKYANSIGVRLIILSNGDLHYFWDIEYGNPEPVTKLPRYASLVDKYQKTNPFKPDADKLVNEIIEKDFIAVGQKYDYKEDPRWHDESLQAEYITEAKLKFLRQYQINAVKRLQKAVSDGRTRFLFEMATGTGKTLVAAAVIRLFLKTGNSKRVLFLVDRIELEDQAKKSFDNSLKPDHKCVIFKENRDDWYRADIVVTTIQSIMHNDKYKDIFSPSDFDLVISDEAHRSIGGNSRAVFEYFLGYKLGLTATPKNYLKNVDQDKLAVFDPKKLEMRQLLDTYITFGCDDYEPTFRYSL
ncbi:TPA: restriction endonuclease subunit R, partial [Candidatus Delongbacteria bacterium]|nr:restriction endonuclease subunit R [Candidatus Delongbacteria bacterium]